MSILGISKASSLLVIISAMMIISPAEAEAVPKAVPKAEVLHWWTSGEAGKSIQLLKDSFIKHGGKWIDSDIRGPDAISGLQPLKARVLSGSAPTAVQLKGPFIQGWHKSGALAFIDEVATKGGWNRLLLPQVRQQVLCDGRYCAVPVNIHRVDWIWGSARVLKAAGVRRMPRSWKEFNSAARKVQAIKKIALAHSGQAWQNATLFETVVLGVGGNQFYQRALIDLEPAALNSDTMVKVFDQMRILSGFVDKDFSGRDWNLATSLIINDKAAFQITGDWAKVKFLTAGKKPGKDFYCSPTPSKGYLYSIDNFAMFKVKGPEKKQGQLLLAKLIMDKKFQKEFNLKKGSIPARLDVSLIQFDQCAKKSSKDILSKSKKGAVLPSLLHRTINLGPAKGKILNTVAQHFNSNLSSKKATQKLAESLALPIPHQQ